MKLKTFLISSIFMLLVPVASISASPAALSNDCVPMGWYPTEIGLKDHAVFEYNGYTYIASNLIPGEQKFVYARSQDYCDWEVLGGILPNRVPGTWDETAIWAPHVIEKNGVYYMYYTGVNTYIAQSMMIATSIDPANPFSWQELGMSFQPTHPGAVWSPTAWSDNRDPMVFEEGGTFYMYYTGRDITGGIIGVATSSSPVGPWNDLGATLGPTPQRIYESATVVKAWNSYYLIYHDTWLAQSNGEMVRSGPSPLGPWGPPRLLQPGWAHEAWQNSAGNWYTSYLTDYTITIAPLLWDMNQAPPRPYIDFPFLYIFLPNIQRMP